MSGSFETAERDTDALYQELILERARAPRHGTLLACFDAEAAGDNPMCGDRVTLRVRRDSAGRIAEAGFAARGCAICLASADLMAEAVQGLAPADARALSARFEAMVRTGDVPAGDRAFGTLRALAGVHDYKARMRCATLPWSALEAALSGREKETIHE